MFYDWTEQPDGSYKRSAENGITCIIKPTNNEIQEQLGQKFEVLTTSEPITLNTAIGPLPGFAHATVGYAVDLPAAKLCADHSGLVWVKSPLQIFFYRLGAFVGVMGWRFVPIFIGYQYFALRFPEVRERITAFDILVALFLLGLDRSYVQNLNKEKKPNE